MSAPWGGDALPYLPGPVDLALAGVGVQADERELFGPTYGMTPQHALEVRPWNYSRDSSRPHPTQPRSEP